MNYIYYNIFIIIKYKSNINKIYLITMGICDCCPESNNKGFSYPNNNSALYNKKEEKNNHNNQGNNMLEVGKKAPIVEQNILEGKAVPIGRVKDVAINKQMKMSICKIYANGKYGTGFLCKIPFLMNLSISLF